MPVRPFVSNNTPLVALWSLGRLDLLRDLFGTVLIPEAVREEFLAVQAEPRGAALEAAPWIEARTLARPRLARAYLGLDQGEAEVLAPAEEVDARLLLLDERRGRRFARRLGRPLTGTVGILLLAKEAGQLESVAEALRRLEEAGLHLSDDLIQRAIGLAGESG
jgi:predicted nucleic acid-binding protein